MKIMPLPTDSGPPGTKAGPGDKITKTASSHETLYL